MPHVDIYYFDKEGTNGIHFFTLVVSQLHGIVLRSGYKDQVRFRGEDIKTVIEQCKQEGYQWQQL